MIEFVSAQPPPADDPGSSAALAAALTAFEQRFEGGRPELVVLDDDSDAALAATLVATKLGIEVAARPSASEPTSANGRLIAQLAGTYTGPP
jgi:hypothetical protein